LEFLSGTNYFIGTKKGLIYKSWKGRPQQSMVKVWNEFKTSGTVPKELVNLWFGHGLTLSLFLKLKAV